MHIGFSPLLRQLCARTDHDTNHSLPDRRSACEPHLGTRPCHAGTQDRASMNLLDYANAALRANHSQPPSRRTLSVKRDRLYAAQRRETLEAGLPSSLKS